ncbi:MAG: DUF4830 domain-containing protein [Oscillospiraceae bacterium]|jgi:hypothetical protein|nr:DUF4830 domain-containing protein [Oscillospiraceae bacterium]
MFVYSVKSSKLKLAALVIVVIAALVALLFLTQGHKAASGSDSLRLAAATAQDRLAFLSQFGWEIGEDPIEVSEVIIPAQFDEAYTKYNEIQKTQNLDLSKYAGKRVKRWTYEVKNYPGYEGKPGVVQANLLIDKGIVVGGDICSLELGGFLHGFAFPQAAKSGVQQSTAAETTKKQ